MILVYAVAVSVLASLPSPGDLVELPFMRTALIELVLLGVAGGLLGAWIVLRRLAFFAHAVGTATFPGLVVADATGFSATLAALAVALGYAGGVERAGRAGRDPGDVATALALVVALALGVVLASDVFESGAAVDRLLFGTALGLGGADLWIAAGAAALAVAATVLLGRAWTAAGFDGPGASALGLPVRAGDLLLLGLIAAAAVAALPAVGALLVASLFVVPAATVRLFATRLAAWQAATVLLIAAEGTLGLWLAVKTDAPPGATIACVSGAAFALAAAARLARRGPGRAAAAGAAALALLALAGCGAAGGAAGERLPVVATTTQVGDWARAVGGEAVEVELLLEPGTDPHAYEPRPSDVVATAGAAVVFASGGDLDAWVEEVVADGGGEAPIVDLGAAVPHRSPVHADGGDDGHGHEGEPDPHWWHDPRNAAAAVREIERRLAAADPARAALYRRNARAYLRRLRRLDLGIARCLATIPGARRKLVTDHDAFGSFARRYGIEVVGAVFPARAAQAQASARDVSELIELIERERVPAIFPESAANSKLAAAIGRQTGAVAGRTLHGDSLGPPGSRAGTYLGMEAANADAIVRGLTDGRRGCDPLR